MPTEIVMKVMPGGLVAANPVEADKLYPLIGREVMARLSQPRNIRFHRRFFALLGTAYQMADTELNQEQFRAYVTCGSGHCDFVNGKDGELVAVPKSISFASMDETEFNRLYQDVLTFICQTWVLDENQLNQIVNFM